MSEQDKQSCECDFQPTAFTIQIGDEPPIFVVNTYLLERLGPQRSPASVAQINAQVRQVERDHNL